MVQNRITTLFSQKKNNILTIYTMAGYPKLNDTLTVIKALQDAGVDMIEIGMPYSDPLADGPVIQEAGEYALANGMSIKNLFAQLKGMRPTITIPVLLMGYLNPVLQFGFDNFVKEAADCGIDGFILPDLPFDEYAEHYKKGMEAHNISNVFLITPQTSAERLKQIDSLGSGFIYAVSTNSTTGNESKDLDGQDAYFKRIAAAGLQNPIQIGFNIKDKETFEHACRHAQGAIIGSAFVRMLKNSHLIADDVKEFVQGIRNA